MFPSHDPFYLRQLLPCADTIIHKVRAFAKRRLWKPRRERDRTAAKASQLAAFGKVIEGMDAVDEIANCDTNAQDRPLKEQKIRTATVETFGETYAVKKA